MKVFDKPKPFELAPIQPSILSHYIKVSDNTTKPIFKTQTASPNHSNYEIITKKDEDLQIPELDKSTLNLATLEHFR